MLRFAVICLFVSWSTVNGFTVREAADGSSINDTINVFSSLADDKNFTSVEPDVNKTESANVSDDKTPVEVSVDKEKEATETEVDKIEIKPSNGEETIESSSSSVSTPTSTSTTTSKPLDSSSVPTVNKPVVSPENDTDSFIANLIASNDTMSNDFFASFYNIDSILGELNGSNNSTNALDLSSGGISSSNNDEFSNSSEMVIRSTRTRGVSPPKDVDTESAYKPPIEVFRGDESKMFTAKSVTPNDLGLTELSTVTENSVDGGKMEIIVDDLRTEETEKHWAKFSAATGYKIIWSSDKGQSERKANLVDEKKSIDQHDGHSVDGHETNEKQKDNCDTMENSGYFVGEIDDLMEIESLIDQNGDKKIIKMLRCGLLRLSKILADQDEEIDDWTNESILPLREISRLEQQIKIQANIKCNCPAPLIGDIVHSIYIDPFLHEKRHQLYKNSQWSSIIGDLRSTHVGIKHFYSQLHRHHFLIENLFNISSAMSSAAYQWNRSKQMDIVINNSRRKVQPNSYRHF